MKSATLYTVPAGARETTCRGCDAPIYWALTSAGRKVPVDCEGDGHFPPTAREEGLGVSHFTTCPNANDFSRTPARSLLSSRRAPGGRRKLNGTR